jgi:hypothetical protein
MATDYGNVDRAEQARNMAILRDEEMTDEPSRPTAGWIALAVFFGAPAMVVLIVWLAWK